MESNNYHWTMGEVAFFPLKTTDFKTSGKTDYRLMLNSRYVCIHPESDTTRGILVKCLGKALPEKMMMVGGEPFCKDVRDEYYKGKSYSSFRFPTLRELTEVLDIIRRTPSLVEAFQSIGRSFDINGSFWIRETGRNLLLQKKPRFYDVRTDSVHTETDNNPHIRLSIAYYYQGKLTW